MLNLTIPKAEFYNEKTGEFIAIEEQTLQLEHSLLSISKWESKWCKPFLDVNDKSYEETIDYIKCMTMNKAVAPITYQYLTTNQIEQIKEYINAPMTATTFSDKQTSKPSREIITSELIYYWMISNQVPLECQKWHLNRLLTLLRVCEIKNSPQKKMSRNEIMAQNKALNAARRAKSGSKG